MKILFLAGILSFTAANLYAQPATKLQNMDYRNLFERAARENDSISGEVNYSMLPYYPASATLNFDSILNSNFEIRNPKKTFWARTFRFGNMLEYVNPEHKAVVTLNPVFDISYGKESGNTVYQNSKGVQLDATIGKITVSSSIYEVVSKFPSYMRAYSDSLLVVPGMGRSRVQSDNSVNYSLPSGYVGYRPNNTFYFELGNDKNFIGSGYRSLLLSDFAYSYPYFKIITDLGKLKYTNIWAQFVDASNKQNWADFNDVKKKYGVFNYLTYTVVKKLELSLFQSIIWRSRDSTGALPINFAYFVPVMYLNTVNFNMGSPDNNVIGMDVNYQIKKHTVVYGQLVIDDFNISKFFKGGKFSGYLQEKYGIQVGAKFFDAFGAKDLFVQTEFNTVRPYVYDEKVPAINYTHYNEALAHPLGANFRELIVKGTYRMKRWFVNGEFLVARYGSDTANSHWGRNIYENENDAQLGIYSYNNKTGQGVKTDLTFATIGVNYLMNPMTNSRFTFQFTHRNENISGISNKTSNYFTLGFSTNLINTYRDF